MKISTLMSVGLTIMCGVSGLATARVLQNDFLAYEKGVAAEKATDVARSIMMASTEMSIERGPTNSLLGTSRPTATQQAALVSARGATDAAIKIAQDAASTMEQEQSTLVLGSLKEASKAIAEARRSADALLAKSTEERGTDELTRVVAEMIASLSGFDAALNAAEIGMAGSDPALLSWVNIARAATEMRDFAGQTGSVFSAALATNRVLSDVELARYERLAGHVDALIEQVRLAHAKLGTDGQLDSIFQRIDSTYLSEGRRVAASIVDRSRAKTAAGLTPADFAAKYVPLMLPIVEFRDHVIERGSEVAAARSRTLLISLGINSLIAAMLAALTAAIVWMFRRRVTQPIACLTQCMSSLANGNHQVLIKVPDPRDEIGAMAAAVDIFRDAAIRNKSLEEEAEKTRRSAEAARIAAHREAEADAEKRLQSATGTLARGIRALAGGNMCCELDEEFEPRFEQLRVDFNSSVSQLRGVLEACNRTTTSIHAQSREMSVASQDLSRRTERQAISLEEAAASLDEITSTVKKTAVNTQHAQTSVDETKKVAEESGKVVQHAIDAMKCIERSAREINQITGVMNDIAFQTNLLALNAGVEAARAGDAGRGFAIVAAEVRALAQRSADSSQEIRALIVTANRDVQQGVTFVGQTSQALSQIVSQVCRMDEIVADIAASTQEQAIALSEVNLTINKMDQVTQQNAAMVEQSTAACHTLADDAHSLSELVSRFKLVRSARGMTAQIVRLPSPCLARRS